MNKKIVIAHACKEPDEVFISDKHVFILEKKWQTVSGSVIEKLQTGVFKQEHYSALYPKHKVTFIFCLSLWFKGNCIAELQYLEKNGIPVFFISNYDWKEALVNYILNVIH